MRRWLAWTVFFCACAAVVAAPITDGAGRTVEFVRTPARVVSMAPATTEIVCAIGGRDQLVGVTRYCAFLEEASGIAQVGGAYDPNYEKIVALRPDAVILSHMADGRFSAQFERLGLTVVILHAEGLSGVVQDILLVGKVLGREAEAVRVADRLNTALEARRASVAQILKTARKPKVLFLYGGPTLLAAGKGSFSGELLEVAGGENIADAAGVPWPQLSREYVLRSDPDIILSVETGATGPMHAPVMDEGLSKRWRDDPVFGRLSAVQKGQIWRLDDRLFSYPGPRLDMALMQLAEILDGYFSSAGFSGKSSEAATESPSNKATTPSDSSMGM